MGLISDYSYFLSTFLALIIAGTGIKLALEEKSEKTIKIRGKQINRQKAYSTFLLIFLGVVIQLVSNTIDMLDGSQLLFDEKILAAYAFSILVMIMKK